METVEFLERVLPSDGEYVSMTLLDGSPRQKFFNSINDLAAHLKMCSDRGLHTYYAVSAFKDVTSRKQTNVRATKVLFLDVDCGASAKGVAKPYADRKEGLLALRDFVIAASLPSPMVVSSGNGLHVYWVLDEELTPEQWRPLADMLKAATQALGFNVDPAITADNARVLRAVGTVNPRGSREVRLLADANIINYIQLSSALKNIPTGKYNLGGVASVAPASQPVKSALLDAMAVKSDYPPSNAESIVAKCPQIAWCVSNQADVMEPLWYAMIGVAAYCADNEKVVVEWSQHHPEFNEDKTLRKMGNYKRSTTGPSTCQRFDALRSDVCKTCKFFGKVSTPAQLGVQYEEVALSPDAPDKVAAEVPLPKSYKRTVKGIKQTIDGTDIDVCNFDIYPVGYGHDQTLGYETVRYHWKRPHVGWTELAFRQAFLTDGSREFPTAIADKGIVLFNKKQTEMFQMLLRSYMDSLRNMRTVTNLYTTMGWKEDNTSFLLGDTLIRKTGNENVSLAARSQRTADNLYGAAGGLVDWVAFTAIPEKAKLPQAKMAINMAFGSPLFQSTGLKGVTVNLLGPTGAGKTLIQKWAQSVYGDPNKLHFSAQFTQNAVFSRFGMYNNLIVTIDEATVIPDKEIGNFLYWVSQGRDKARLNSSAEEREARTWATMCMTSANQSFASKMMSSGMDTDAQLARLLEVTIHPHVLFTRSTDFGRKIDEFLADNYGTAGEVYLAHLVSLGPDQLKAMVRQHQNDFRTKYNVKFSGQERFVEQCIVLADLGGKIASELGLIQYDYEDGTRFVLNQLGMIRQTATTTKMDAFDMVSAYMNDCGGASLTVMHTLGQKPLFDTLRLPRNGIRVRIDVHRPTVNADFNAGTVMLDKKHFREWVNLNKGDFNAIMKELELEGVIATPQSGKYSFGKDTPLKVGQLYAIGINLNHSRMQGILNDADDAIDNLTLGQLQVVN